MSIQWRPNTVRNKHQIPRAVQCASPSHSLARWTRWCCVKNQRKNQIKHFEWSHLHFFKEKCSSCFASEVFRNEVNIVCQMYSASFACKNELTDFFFFSRWTRVCCWILKACSCSSTLRVCFIILRNIFNEEAPHTFDFCYSKSFPILQAF